MRRLFAVVLVLYALGIGVAAGENESVQSENKIYKFCFGDPKVGCAPNMPKPLKDPDPQYSKEALKKKVEGTVVLRVLVRKDGSVEIMEVVKSLGYGLDEEAIKAVRKWKFSPATLADGTPVAVVIHVQARFRRS